MQVAGLDPNDRFKKRKRRAILTSPPQKMRKGERECMRMREMEMVRGSVDGGPVSYFRPLNCKVHATRALQRISSRARLAACSGVSVAGSACLILIIFRSPWIKSERLSITMYNIARANNAQRPWACKHFRQACSAALNISVNNLNFQICQERERERERKREREKGLVIFYSNSTRLAIDAGRPAERTECRIIKDLSHK